MKSMRFSVLAMCGAAIFTLLGSAGFAQQPQASISLRPPPINWILGPAKVDLGNNVEIAVPEGFRLAVADQAQILLRLGGNPVHKELAGVLQPASERWMVVLEISEIGYVKDTGKARLDASSILETIREKVLRQNEQGAKSGQAPITAVNWGLVPTNNPAQHTVEWAVRAENSQGISLNHTVCLLGRNSVLTATAVQSQSAGDFVPLKRIVECVSFKPGFAYADFQAGDKIATRGITGLITSDDVPDKAVPGIAGISYVTLGIIAGSVIGGALALFFLIKIWKHAKALRAELKPLVHPQLNGHYPVNGGSSIHQNGVNGNANGHYKGRRRRMFNYQKYYSDLMMQVSDRAYETTGSSPRTESTTQAPQAKVIKPVATATAPGSLSSNIGLIESQRNLIEEQQRLIREQTKLIEEKTRLIQEKNQVLDKQAELFGNNIF